MLGDKLILGGLQFHEFHGVKPEERTWGQKFLIDIDVWMDLRPAGISDQLSDTARPIFTGNVLIPACVGALFGIEHAKEVVEGTPENLLESVAEKIAPSTLSRHPRIFTIRVKVGKPHVAVHGPLDYLGVEIVRHRIELTG